MEPMKSIGEQLNTILTRRAESFPVVAEAFTIDLSERMKQNTESGVAFGADEYDNQYTEPYARRAKGGSITPVTLRHLQRRIEQTRETRTETGAEIVFQDDEGSRIFKLHHTGRARGGKVRSIWPKQVQSVPLESREIIRSGVKEALQP